MVPALLDQVPDERGYGVCSQSPAVVTWIEEHVD